MGRVVNSVERRLEKAMIQVSVDMFFGVSPRLYTILGTLPTLLPVQSNPGFLEVGWKNFP